eukprot:2510430-Rhodomonas_salina.1
MAARPATDVMLADNDLDPQRRERPRTLGASDTDTDTGTGRARDRDTDAGTADTDRDRDRQNQRDRDTDRDKGTHTQARTQTVTDAYTDTGTDRYDTDTDTGTDTDTDTVGSELQRESSWLTAVLMQQGGLGLRGNNVETSSQSEQRRWRFSHRHTAAALASPPAFQHHVLSLVSQPQCHSASRLLHPVLRVTSASTLLCSRVLLLSQPRLACCAARAEP